MPRFDRLEVDASPRRAHLYAPHAERNWLVEAAKQRMQGTYERALQCYSRALQSNAATTRAWAGQVQMLVLLDEVAEAVTWSRKALELFPNSGDLLAAHAQAVCRTGDVADALSFSDAALVAPGQTAYRWQARGEILLAQGATMHRHLFDKAFQAHPHWLVQVESALIYLHYGLPTEALARARSASESDPRECYAWLVRARAETQLRWRREARHSLSQCAQLCPGHHDAGALLAALERGRWWPTGWLERWFR